MPRRKAKDDFYEFHGRKPRWKKVRDFHAPKTLIVLGKIHAVEYECNKFHGGGDGKRAVYRHKFETPGYLCMDEHKAEQLYILGSDIVVTERGIEN